MGRLKVIPSVGIMALLTLLLAVDFYGDPAEK